MHLSTQSQMASCPYCGEPGEFVVDPSVPQQQYVEDCYVCCQPILVSVDVVGEDITITLYREDDA